MALASVLSPQRVLGRIMSPMILLKCLRLPRFGRESTHSTETVRVLLGPSTAASTLPGLTLATANISWDFTYKMTDKDRFQTFLVKDTYDKVEWTSGPNCVEDENGEVNCATLYFDVVGPIDGVMSRDGDSIIMTCGQPTKLILCVPEVFPCVRTPFEAYCSFSHQGFRVRDKLR